MFDFGPGELFVIVAMSAAVCGWVAHRKGLPVRYFIALGIALPLVGILIALAWSRRGRAAA